MAEHPIRHLRWLGATSRAFAVFGGLLLTSCAELAPTLPLPPPPPPPPPAMQPRVHAAWSFDIKPQACLAVAVAGRTRLELAVRGAGPIYLRVTLPTPGAGKPVARFHGPAGTWWIPGRHAGRYQMEFTLGHDINALSRVLMLLSGGVLDLQLPGRKLPIVILSSAGAEGQQWFACARRNVI